MKYIYAIVLFLVLGSTAYAHSTVSPSQTSVSKYETFTLSVPTEKDIPTTEIRLIVPPELERFTPFVKPGWRVAFITDSAGKTEEVLWVGGSIPKGQKDVFQFTARTPKEEAKLAWKVYQKYQNGEVVAWDMDPSAGDEANHGEGVPNPYSVTTVVDEAAGKPRQKAASPATIVSIISLVISLAALAKAKK